VSSSGSVPSRRSWSRFRIRITRPRTRRFTTAQTAAADTTGRVGDVDPSRVRRGRRLRLVRPGTDMSETMNSSEFARPWALRRTIRVVGPSTTGSSTAKSVRCRRSAPTRPRYAAGAVDHHRGARPRGRPQARSALHLVPQAPRSHEFCGSLLGRPSSTPLGPPEAGSVRRLPSDSSRSSGPAGARAPPPERLTLEERRRARDVPRPRRAGVRPAARTCRPADRGSAAFK
jgi:hypothetical protein